MSPDEIKKFVDEKKNEIYKSAEAGASVNINGGGSLSLDSQSVIDLSYALIGPTKLIPGTQHALEPFRILWIGQGFGEEPMLLALLLGDLYITHRIVSIDMEDYYTEYVTAACVKHKIKTLESITMDGTNILAERSTLHSSFDINNSNDVIDVIYTSGALSPHIFATILYQALQLKVKT